VLDKAVAVLKEFPKIRMEIDGHTDNVGKEQLNTTLSQKRAEAVRDYFVSKGIDQGRLEAKGFGPTKPVADNATPAGRAKNRRVEFKLLQN
ncbi:MAG: OmpA family protein, partial [Deltaproteobacteria bacterium]|nr:OmpA family protein [Deltaproteobacteria bacterium]